MQLHLPLSSPSLQSLLVDTGYGFWVYAFFMTDPTGYTLEFQRLEFQRLEAEWL